MEDAMNDIIGPNKAISAGAFGAFTIVVVWTARAAFQIEVPPEVASAMTVLISTAATWFTPAGTRQVSFGQNQLS
jgi:hypothetical protein